MTCRSDQQLTRLVDQRNGRRSGESGAWQHGGRKSPSRVWAVCPAPAATAAATDVGSILSVDVGRLVWTRIAQEPGAPAWIVCPDPRLNSLHLAGWHRAYHLLIRAPCGEVCMFKVGAGFWGATTLLKFARLVSDALEQTHWRWAIPSRLSAHRDTAIHTVEAPVLDRVDETQWATRPLAVALVVQAALDRGATTPAGELELLVGRIQARIHAELSSALRDLCATLNPRAKELATRAGFDIGIYNYLAGSASRRNREQVFAGFPILADAAARKSNDLECQTLREMVDAGAPLVKSLAASWGVAPAAVRNLRYCRADLLPAPLRGKPWLLARMLDALCPEDRPGDDPHAWQQFARATVVAQKLFGVEAWQSRDALDWLHDSARANWRALDTIEALDLGGAVTNSRVLAMLRRTLCIGLASTVGQQAGPGVRSSVVVRALAVIHRWMCRYTVAELDRLLTLFNRRVGLQVADRDCAATPAESAPVPALLSEPFMSRSGQRVIVSLDSTQRIHETGLALHNCLDRSRHRQFVAMCAIGQAFLVALRDPGAGLTHSVAQFEPIWRRAAAQPWRLHLVEHTGPGNAKASLPCQQAIDELLAAFGAGGSLSRHLQALMETRQPSLNRALAASHPMHVQVLLPAAVQTIGQACYRKLASELSALEADVNQGTAALRA